MTQNDVYKIGQRLIEVENMRSDNLQHGECEITQHELSGAADILVSIINDFGYKIKWKNKGDFGAENFCCGLELVRL